MNIEVPTLNLDDDELRVPDVLEVVNAFHIHASSASMRRLTLRTHLLQWVQFCFYEYRSASMSTFCIYEYILFQWVQFCFNDYSSASMSTGLPLWVHSASMSTFSFNEYSSASMTIVRLLWVQNIEVPALNSADQRLCVHIHRTAPCSPLQLDGTLVVSLVLYDFCRRFRRFINKKRRFVTPSAWNSLTPRAHTILCLFILCLLHHLIHRRTTVSG